MSWTVVPTAMGDCSGVGAGEVAVGSRATVGVSSGVDVGILVGADVLVGDSGAASGNPSHAASTTTASKLASPIHTLHQTDFLTRPPMRKMSTNGCVLLDPMLLRSTTPGVRITYGARLNIVPF